MTKLVAALMIVGLFILPSSASHKKKADGGDATDWLNAPTPDGSPTLKETSDWLASTLGEYGGNKFPDLGPVTVIADAHIDNRCTFEYQEISHSTSHFPNSNISLPLGAVTQILPHQDLDRGVVGVDLVTGNVNAVVIKYVDAKAGSDSAAARATIIVSRTPPPRAGAEVAQQPSQMIPRIISAMQHAVDLCHSAYQPAAQTKQPF
jgi:hypothetical protein